MGGGHHRYRAFGLIQPRGGFADPDPAGHLGGSGLSYFESRRYLYYDLFRVRVRVMEINFYGPMLRGQGIRIDNRWNELLADDYDDLRFHITLMESLGRRIRRTYGWIFSALLVCFVAKIIVHPTALTSGDELWAEPPSARSRPR